VGGVREAAADALGTLGDVRAVDPLIAALGDGDGGVRWAAANALGILEDDRALEPLILALEQRHDDELRLVAASALGELGDARAVDPLLAALGDPATQVRLEAINSLPMVALTDQRIVDALVPLADDADPDLRLRALAALAWTGQPEAFARLQADLLGDDRERRLQACEALALTAPEITDFLLLSEQLDGSQPFVDPVEPFSEARIANAAETLDIPQDDVRARLDELTRRFAIGLGEQPGKRE
jgi:HEAT repeat protein